MITHLFVYGTLRPGQRRWPFLEPFVTDEGRDDSASGALYDTGHDYPAAKFDRGGTISGRVYPLRTDRLDEALTLLDEVEGAVQDLFARIAITTTGGVEAWAYAYVGGTEFPAIASGDWLKGEHG
ncbi:MAG: gamma-glutamylcyclotransferase family protein [Ilumatobacteraceae bacterium]